MMKNRELQMAEYADKLINQILPQAGKIVLDIYAINQLAILCSQVKRST